MASDAVTLIRNDHRILEDLFKQVSEGSGDRQELLEEIATLLTAHSRAEEQEVYPAIAAAAPDRSTRIEHATHEHDEAEELLENALQSLDSPEFDDIFAEFVEVVTHHVEAEETEVLPALRDAVDPATLDRLGAAFARVRADELRKAGYDDEYEHSAAYDRGADDASRDELSWATREHH
jgi:hemerythrin superfamily protein